MVNNINYKIIDSLKKILGNSNTDKQKLTPNLKCCSSNSSIYELQCHLNYLDSITNSMKLLNEKPLSSTDQITSIKSQLKHCKNPLQKLNMEREMNQLIREKRKEIKCINEPMMKEKK